MLADDSGLEVDALKRCAGRRSARYRRRCGLYVIDSEMPDGRNNLTSGTASRTLATVDGAIAVRARAGARWRDASNTASGAVEGEIIAEPHGAGGFGYDPLFWLPGAGKTMGEIDLETKRSSSHRGLWCSRRCCVRMELRSTTDPPVSLSRERGSCNSNWFAWRA